MIKRNPNLRKLAIAHAQGKVDNKTYRKLRTVQLSALDFNKPQPELPPECADIEIPNINIDPPRKTDRHVSIGKIIKWIVVLAAIAVLAASAYYFWSQPQQTSNNNRTSVNERNSLQAQAQQLSGKVVWTQRDLDQFMSHWLELDVGQRNKARSSPWFSKLETALKQQIEQVKELVTHATEADENKRWLDELRMFYAYLKTE